MKIIPFRKSHLESVLTLTAEFEKYLDSLTTHQRRAFDVEKKRKQLLEYGFGKHKMFSGYVAKIWKEIVWFALYHYGFDPDDAEGKVIYMFDLFITESARRHGVGQALIEKLQSHEDSLWLYFGVWKKNPLAIAFYKKLWAEWMDDTPFMRIIK
jgi:GNAT superfamily N-acetyltransferase